MILHRWRPWIRTALSLEFLERLPARFVYAKKGQFFVLSFLFPIKKLTRLSCFANLDFVTQVFDSTRQALRGSLLIDACEIECSEIAVRHLIAQ